MKNKKILIALIALIAVVGVMIGIYDATRQKPQDPTEPNSTKTTGTEATDSSGSEATDPTGTEPQYARSFTFIVVHSDGSEKTFTIGTNRDYLADALLDEKLIVESDSPGLYNTVDGETADYNVNQSWWKFIINGQDSFEGMNTTVIQDGAVYKLVYTIGF